MLFSLLSQLYSQSTTLEATVGFHERGGQLITDEVFMDLPRGDYEFVGLSCYHLDVSGDAANIRYRLQVDGLWTSWMDLELQHEFVAPSRRAYFAKPVQSAFTEIQFLADTRIASDLTVRLFFADESPSIDRVQTRATDCELPEACYRECWCPTCPIDLTPQLTDPTHLIVHHSAGNNESNDFATVVEYIWDLHVNTNGWDDIGYNWLIDPNGILYEGRPDSYQGAHFSCINENTVGICVLGDYSAGPPSEEAISTLVNVLAYEATEQTIDITTDSYHETGDFVLDNIAGHRDSSESPNACSSTLCPGDSFYPLLADIRLQVSELPCYSGVSSAADDLGHREITVFPNPISNTLYVHSDSESMITYDLINIQGAKVGVVITGIANDVSYLNPGVYIVSYKGHQIMTVVKE